LLIREFLEGSNSPKKRLGQHFLTNTAYIRKIVDAAKVESQTPVAEIGPGTGSLTSELALRTERLKVIEFDSDAAEFIKGKFPTIEVINADVLTVDIAGLFGEKITLVGNLPYNISVKILEHCVKYIDGLERMVFMFQGEVADRILSAKGRKTYSSLSVYSQYHFAVKKICGIGGGNFFPKTKVNSSVLEFIPYEKRRLPPDLEEGFFLFLKNCFKQKRKTLSNNLCSPGLNAALEELALPKNIRAEQLSLDDFLYLYDRISK
jgi:16S rRNA (adenine1518-N6/adenine1519-N6)-dimethyltransferase